MSVYDKIKYLGDIKHKIPTQCCIEPKLFKQGKVNMAVSGGARVGGTFSAN
jgi:hypothetical protein